MTTHVTHFAVGSGATDRMKVSRAFWDRLSLVRLTPGVVLRHANLSPTLANDGQFLSTVQLFAIWRSIHELSKNPAAGWKMITGTASAKYPPTVLAALHARDYREALERHARYKQLCSAQEFRFSETAGEFCIEASWPFAADLTPPTLLIDVVFAWLIELGRRGTQMTLHPKRLELARPKEIDSGLETCFGCPVKYNCRRDRFVLSSADVGRPFVTHNEDLVGMLAPQFDEKLKSTAAAPSISTQVKGVLSRLLSGSRPDVAMVAKELGMSERTLQRRITEEGLTFRQLLNQTRMELVREYLGDDSIQITEAAFLVGFENANSFYRAFRAWEGMTPAEWRAAQRGKQSIDRNRRQQTSSFPYEN